LFPGYQFCTVEYFISASSSAINSTTAACNWFSSRLGAVQPLSTIHNCLHRQQVGSFKLSCSGLIDSKWKVPLGNERLWI
jgi:hypothetical protein